MVSLYFTLIYNTSVNNNNIYIYKIKLSLIYIYIYIYIKFKFEACSSGPSGSRTKPRLNRISTVVFHGSKRTERQSVCKREFKKRIYIGKRKSLTDLGKHQNLIVTLLSWFSLCFLFLFGIEKGIQILEYIYIQHSLFVLSHYLVIVSLSLSVSLPDKTVRLPKRDRGV